MYTTAIAMCLGLGLVNILDKCISAVKIFSWSVLAMKIKHAKFNHVHMINVKLPSKGSPCTKIII